MILKFDGLLPISNPDRIIFSQLGVEKPMQVMSAGIDIHRFKSITPNNSGAIFHLGSMDWMPNQEAVSWFLQEVWPGLHKQLPSARFHYAGRNMPERFKANDTVGVKAFGEVEDAYAFMQQQGIMVVPLFSGSGMRVKVIEGMALGKCMVSTKTGMEGVDAVAGKHYFEANTAVEFISTLVMLLVQPEKAVNVGLEARKFAFENYNNDTIIENSIVFLKSLKS